MTYNITNYAPDADAVVVTINDSFGNKIDVTISRVIGGYTQISVTQKGSRTIERGTLGGEFHMETDND